MTRTEREALVALYDATDGPNWRNNKNWNTDADLSEWAGVRVNHQGNVFRLELPENSLRGHIPPQLGDLGALQYLSLIDNELDGHIPPQLGHLGALQYLSLSKNKLDGPIPEELGKLTAVKELHLNGNKLSGAIPAQLGALNKLTRLGLSINQLSGHIPRQLGDLGALQYLGLSNNKLDGHIPPQLGDLGALQVLDLDNNKLHGHIPPELGALSELQKLNLNSNKLTGHIPSELGDLSELQKLWLSSNKLTGSMPPELGNLAALQVLNLRGNELSGRIPEELGKLTALQELLLDNNQLSGHIPPQLGDLGALQYLFLNNQNLDGNIPPQLGQLDALKSLHLSNNKLDGPIPKELGALSNLTALFLKGNELTGSIPAQLGALKVVGLDLSSNQLSGHIPSELGNLRELNMLSLSNNQLSALWDHSSDDASHAMPQQGCTAGASIPKQLGKLLAMISKVKYLEIDNNPWKEPPEAVVKKGMSAVSEYFADLYAEGVVPVLRSMIKVVLVGQEGAGKTSLRQSIRNRRPTPTSGPEESTVQIDVEEMEMDVEGVSLRVYDCAGQVAYTGLLQMFLSPRAVTLLVCNTEAFGQRDVRSSNTDQLEHDLSKLHELRVCDWLRCLSLRIPDSDVVVVATKCDLADGMAGNLAGRIGCAIRAWLGEWAGSEMTAARVEDDVSLTSCVATLAPEEEGGAVLGKRQKPEDSMWACDWREDMCDDLPPSLLHRVMYNSKGDLRGAAMVLPSSWNIALEVLESLGNGRDPVESVRQIKLNAEEPEGSKGVASATAKQGKGIEGLTMLELSSKWRDVIKALEGDGLNVTNPNHALEGALRIREHQGSVVRHETYVFLDVTWLARILKPLLNHRDNENPLRGSISLGDTGITLDDEGTKASWKRFKKTGVLESALASVLWPGDLAGYVLPTLDALGLSHPLDCDSAERRVVLLRLGEERPDDVANELEDFRRSHEAVLSVTWKIFLGVPPGSIEKVLTRCCSIGALRTFWRFGVLVQGGFGGVTAGKTFALLIEYSHERTELDINVFGNIGTAAPWAALSFGISAVRKMCSEFPGLRWRASLKCPQHAQDMEIAKNATKPSDKLLVKESCSLCSSETGGVGAAATDLLEVVDVFQSKGEIFREVHERFVKLQTRYPVLRPEELQRLQPEQAQRRVDSWLSEMKEEMESLLHGPKGSTDEVAKLQRLVGDLQQQLAQQHQDVRGWLGVVDKRLEAFIDADDGVMGKLDFIVPMLMAMRRKGFDTPRRACVLPPWQFAQAHGLSEDEQIPEEWVKRLNEWREDDFKEGKGFFKKKKRLFLVCAHTHRLVPCGPNGQGYDIQQLRTWLRMSVSVAKFALQVVCFTLAAIAAAPVSGAGAALEAAVSAATEKLGSTLEAQLASLNLHDHGGGVDVGPQVESSATPPIPAAQLERDAYAFLREFIHGEEDSARLDIAKANRGRRGSSDFVFFEQEMVQVQRRAGDAAVQWVLKGQENAWLSAMRSAPIA